MAVDLRDSIEAYADQQDLLEELIEALEMVRNEYISIVPENRWDTFILQRTGDTLSKAKGDTPDEQG